MKLMKKYLVIICAVAALAGCRDRSNQGGTGMNSDTERGVDSGNYSETNKTNNVYPPPVANPIPETVPEPVPENKPE